MSEPLWQWSATRLAEAIRTRQHSSTEVVEAYLERITRINPHVNALTNVLGDDALIAAKLADEAVAAGKPPGPLHGVPVTIKDVFDLAGVPNTFGIVGMKDQVPARDAPVVAHLKHAGAIPIGRTNVPDFGIRWHTENDLFGATVNPWDPARTPGGSSGGEAAAIATGMSPLGIGGDMGGSLRYPAQCCGIAALKPGLGRVSKTFTSLFDDPPLFYEQNANVSGPMARCIEDLRLALQVISAADHADPLWQPAPKFASAQPEPIHIAVVIDPAGDGRCPAVEEAVRHAADILSDAGYCVEEHTPPSLERTTEVIERIANAETMHYLPGMREMMSPVAGRYLETLVRGTQSDLTSYMQAIGERHRITAQWQHFMQDFPLVLGPVSTRQPFEVGFDTSGSQALQSIVRSLTLTEACNLLGLPSVAVPVQVADGLPQGVQLIGPRFHEELCLDAAEAIERSVGLFTPIEPCISV